MKNRLSFQGEQKVIAYKEIKNGTLYTIVFNSTFQINLLGKSCSIQLDLKCIAAMESRSILRRDFDVCNDGKYRRYCYCHYRDHQ